MDIPYVQKVVDAFSASLKKGGQVRLKVNGTSMSPFLAPGDILVVQGVDPSALQCGDLIVVRREQDLVTHRLVGVNEQGWYTKGDGVRFVDPPVAAESILGRVVSIERREEQIDLRDEQWVTVNRRLGRLGWLETRTMQTARSMKIRLAGNLSGSCFSVLGSLFDLPFRFFRRALIYYYETYKK
jgi:hypothetical protein